jgi:putative SOS response-associated peptidase YedK
MCGRFTLTAEPSVIQHAFDLDSVPGEMVPRYNIAPTQPVAVITNEDPSALTFHRWGLIPSWSKDPSIGSKMINARSETADSKPSFRSAYKRRRCLIPASGFYEWRQGEDGKAPMYIHLDDHKVFAFAGLWEVWHGPDGEELRTCTILTGEPNSLIRPIHNRMAIILPEAHYDLWLSPDELGVDVLGPVLQPYDPDEMRVYEVSKLVNKPSNDTPENIEPYAPPQQQGLL